MIPFYERGSSLPRSWQASVRQSEGLGGSFRRGNLVRGALLMPGRSQEVVVYGEIPGNVCLQVNFFRGGNFGQGAIPTATSRCASVPASLAEIGEFEASQMIDERIGRLQERYWPEPVKLTVDTLANPSILPETIPATPTGYLPPP